MLVRVRLALALVAVARSLIVWLVVVFLIAPARSWLDLLGLLVVPRRAVIEASLLLLLLLASATVTTGDIAILGREERVASLQLEVTVGARLRALRLLGLRRDLQLRLRRTALAGAVATVAATVLGTVWEQGCENRTNNKNKNKNNNLTQCCHTMYKGNGKPTP